MSDVRMLSFEQQQDTGAEGDVAGDVLERRRRDTINKDLCHRQRQMDQNLQNTEPRIMVPNKSDA